MTNKLHNRTLFVAALSVYFGLLIVGAPPQVLAQTNLKEIAQVQFQEVCNQTENDSKRLLAAHLLGEPMQNLLLDIKDLFEENKLNITNEFSLNFEIALADGEQTRITTKSNVGWLDANFQGIIYDFRGVIRGSHHQIFDEKFQKKAYYWLGSVDLNSDGLSVKVKTEQDTPRYAQLSATFDNSVFQVAACQEKDAVRKAIYENTKSLAEGNNLIVVTNLPRAALGSLLKAGEKAN